MVEAINLNKLRWQVQVQFIATTWSGGGGGGVGAT